jgi:hypothetical protein
MMEPRPEVCLHRHALVIEVIDARDLVGREIHPDELCAARDDPTKVRRRGVQDPECILLVDDDALDRHKMGGGRLARDLVPGVHFLVWVRDERAIGGDLRDRGVGLVDPPGDADEEAAGARDGDWGHLLWRGRDDVVVVVARQPLEQTGGILHDGLGVEHRPDINETFTVEAKEVVKGVLDALRRRHLPHPGCGREVDIDGDDVYRGDTGGDAVYEPSDLFTSLHGDAADGTEELDLG